MAALEQRQAVRAHRDRLTVHRPLEGVHVAVRVLTLGVQRPRAVAVVNPHRAHRRLVLGHVHGHGLGHFLAHPGPDGQPHFMAALLQHRPRTVAAALDFLAVHRVDALLHAVAGVAPPDSNANAPAIAIALRLRFFIVFYPLQGGLSHRQGYMG